MPLRSSKDGTGRRRYARRATKSRITLRPPRHPGRWIAIFATIVVAVTLALIWGSILDRRSEAYREQESEKNWILSESGDVYQPSPVPAVRAGAILPEQNTAPFLAAYGGILLPLRAADGGLYFASSIATEAGIPPVRPPLAAAGEAVSPDGLSLPDEVARIARRGLRVIAVFPVTYPDAPDAATRVYRRGLDLALLADYAAAGMDDLLILGLPCGDDDSDREAMAFVTELRALTASLPDAPTVGLVLPLDAFASELSEADTEGAATGAVVEGETAQGPLYAGRMTPGRMADVCDFLVLDLRTHTADELERLLPQLQFAYVRYSLRLMVAEDTARADVLLSHGFERIFEMGAPMESESESIP